jgi:hypothetical protein
MSMAQEREVLKLKLAQAEITAHTPLVGQGLRFTSWFAHI